MPKRSSDPATVTPQDDAINAAFDTYVSAVSKASHAWNRFQEELGQLFAVVAKGNRDEMLAIWYSANNDRAQRNMLRAVINAKLQEYWSDWLETDALNDLTWLLEEADKLAQNRNDAIHAPA